MADRPLTLVTDDDGTAYSVETDGPARDGVECFTILTKDERDEWAQVVGGFGVKRKGASFDPSTLTVNAVHEERSEIARRVARRFLAV
jgi:FixJ family two-component response regulator